MKVLVIYAHPNPKSFNHAILESFTRGLAEAGHPYEKVDLYGINFNPCLRGEDIAQLMEGKVPDDVRAQQEKVSEAEGLVFIHPIWWTGPPAILKGWIDRVFSIGFAYAFDEKDGHPIGLLKNQKALVINTSGAAEEDAKVTGSDELIKKLMDDAMLRFCGINNVQRVVFFNVLMTDEKTRSGYLNEAYELGKNF